MKAYHYILLVVLLSACNSDVKKSGADTSKVLDTTRRSPMAEGNLLTKPVAVIITPSERLINKVKGTMEGASYNSVVDDNGFYLSESTKYLDSVKADKVYRESEGSVRFKAASGTYEMKLDTMFFGIILFNGKDKPIKADMTDLKTDFEKYMRNKSGLNYTRTPHTPK